MWLSKPIVLWMEYDRLDALSKALAAPDDYWCGANIQQFMQDKLDRLYELKVSPAERQRIEGLPKKPEPGDDFTDDKKRPDHNTLFRVAEKDSVHMVAVFNIFDLFDVARITDCYRRGGLALLKPPSFLNLLGDMRFAYPSEFAAAIDGKSWHGNKLAGVYNLDFDKDLVAVSDSLMEWTAYGMDDVCAAARHVCGGSTGDAIDEMRTAFREALSRIEKQPYHPLESYTFRRH